MFRSSVWLSVVLAVACFVVGCCGSVHSQSVPVIFSIQGCTTTVGNGTMDCNFNVTVWIYGANFPTSSFVDVLIADSKSYYATSVVAHNSSVLSARLPYIPTDQTVTYSVQAQFSGVVSNVVQYIAYQSQVPRVDRVTGCPVNNVTNNGTSLCQPGMSITIEGVHFAPDRITPHGYLYVVLGFYSSIDNITYISTSRLVCVLPTAFVGSYNEWLSVVVYTGDLHSDSVYAPQLVSYAPPPSSSSSSSSTGRSNTTSSTGTISSSLTTCPVSQLLSGYDLPGFDLYHVSLPSVDLAQCQSLCCSNAQCRSFTVCRSNFNDSACRLDQPCCFLKYGVPVPVLRNNTIAQLSSAVITRLSTTSSSSSSSSTAPASNTLAIINVNGCTSVDYCVAGDQITISGRLFNSKTAVSLYVFSVNTMYLYSRMVKYVDSNTLRWEMPMMPLVDREPIFVQLLVSNNDFVNNASLGILYYPHPLPTPQPPTPSPSKSDLTTGSIIAIVLVVVIVALLLMCQVAYCLQRFAGVKFSRLARLTGGRVFKVEVAAEDGAAVDLSLLAHDHQHQQPMLREAHFQPQAAPLPPNAAAPYHNPVVYQPPPPVQPIPAAHYHTAHPPPPGAAPYLYPRSFVPSPHYYQPAL